MNVQSNLRMDKPAFLDWVQGRTERYELSKSRIVMMMGGSRGHAIVTRRLAAALERRLDTLRFTVLTSDFGVDLGPDTVRYPDVVVDVAGGPLKDLTATAPVLIAEVISLPSATYDLGDKAAEYLKLAGLSAYVVLAQDEPKAWIWARNESGLPPGPAVIAGMAEAIAVPALGIDLPLSEIFAGLDPNP
jgi:Uma2 family endonuclease